MGVRPVFRVLAFALVNPIVFIAAVRSQELGQEAIASDYLGTENGSQERAVGETGEGEENKQKDEKLAQKEELNQSLDQLREHRHRLNESIKQLQLAQNQPIGAEPFPTELNLTPAPFGAIEEIQLQPGTLNENNENNENTGTTAADPVKPPVKPPESLENIIEEQEQQEAPEEETKPQPEPESVPKNGQNGQNGQNGLSLELYRPEDWAGLAENFLIPQVFGEVNLSNFNTLEFKPFPKPEAPSPPLQPTPSVLEDIEKLVQNAMGNTSGRYPWILNSSDNLSFAPLLFKAKRDSNYFNTDFRWSPDTPVINQFTFGLFPQQDQFYWVLDNNRIVAETIGGQGGLIFQGLEQDFKITQAMTLTQSFAGYQAVWVIPNDFQRILRVDNLQDYQIISVGGSLTTPEGTQAAPVIINSGIDFNDENVILIPTGQAAIVDPAVGGTYSQRGGGALFDNLQVENSPLVLQAFPTTDLTALADVELKRGTVIPKDILEKAGISWGDVFSGTPSTFKAPITSLPGIKVAQLGKFDNYDLLNVLVNPFLSPRQKNLHYLNSLLWVPLGVRQPEFNTITHEDKTRFYDWYRFYFGITHNRMILQYDPEKTEASYANVFSNPGFSLSFAYNYGGFDEIQILNATLGMAAGLIFEGINTHNIDESLAEAKKKRDEPNVFAPLKTKMTTQERRSINQRLNSTLAYATLGSGLNQVSGFITFPSSITPTQSNLFQIKTGNIKRAVQFVQLEVGDWVEGETFISEARLSNRDFSPLTFSGTPLPLPPVGVKENESNAAEVILLGPEGRKFIQRYNSSDLTTVPVGVKIFDIAFDRLVLQRIDTRDISSEYYNGYLYLPTVEGVFAGSDRDFTYSINTGVWFNVNPNSAGNIENNNFGLKEPWIGVYTNAIVTSTTTNFFLTPENKITGIITQIPSLRFTWNSAFNRNNPWQLSMSYTTFYQTATSNYSLTGGVSYISDYGNGPVVGLLYGQIGFDSGTNINFNAEIGEQTYYNANVLQQILPNISIGPYVSNYTEINFGFNGRLEGINYGGIIQHKFPDSPVTFSAKFGTGDNGFEARINGGYRF